MSVGFLIVVVVLVASLIGRLVFPLSRLLGFVSFLLVFVGGMIMVTS